MLSSLKKLIPLDFPLRIWYHQMTGYFAALVFGFPARKMIVIGVTGTNGKTTVTHLITQLLSNVHRNVGMASTVGFQIGETYIQNTTHKTTMGRFSLQKMLAGMRDKKCETLVLECSSHALSQGRLNGIPFSTGVFTNLSREHLDYHRTMERYFKEKEKLFKKISNQKKSKKRVIVTNIDDEYGARLLKHDADITIGISLNADNESTETMDVITAKDIKNTPNGLQFTLCYHGQNIPIESPLLGDYNVYNLLLASGVAIAHGVSLDVVKLNLNSFKGILGRLEKVGKTSTDATVYIDYAVTPDSFEVLFRALRPLTIGDLIAVFGACGDRDSGKRPDLGTIAANLCDKVVVTTEEPYTEDPESIIDMIWEGVKETNKELNKNAFRITDREEAIKFALTHAGQGDVIVITGMGDQTSMTVGNKHVHWSDREIIKKYL